MDTIKAYFKRFGIISNHIRNDYMTTDKLPPFQVFPMQKIEKVAIQTQQTISLPLAIEDVIKKYFSPIEKDVGWFNQEELDFYLKPFYKMLYLIGKIYCEITKTTAYSRVVVFSNAVQTYHAIIEVNINDKSQKMVIYKQLNLQSTQKTILYPLFSDFKEDFNILYYLFKQYLENIKAVLKITDFRQEYHGFQYVMETNFIKLAQILGQYDTDIFNTFIVKLFK